MGTLKLRAPTALWLCVVGAMSLIFGWSNGYHAITSYLTWWLLAALPILSARRLVLCFWPSDDFTEDAVRMVVVALAIVVGCGLLVGGMRLLTVWAYVSAEAVLLAVSYAVAAAPPLAIDDRLPSRERPLTVALVVGTGGALLAFAFAFAATHAPTTLYDSLSYHLFFAGRWVQDHALSIVPTPFSDEAQAYAPANGEVFFAWLMLPFHGDLFARFGQLPFALFASAALYLLAKRLGAPPEGAIYPSIFLLLSRPVLEQAVGANVDLICASLFLAALYFGLVAADGNGRRDWILWGVILGLYAGTKYLALVYLPILLVLALTRGPRARTLWALPGLAAFALPWYARNWLIAGSPLYPASLTVGGLTIGRGAFDRGAMLNTVFHSTDARIVPAIAAHGLGPTMFVLWLPVAVIGGVAMLRRSWWPHAFVLLVPPLVVALCWVGVPVNVDSRFLMPAIAPALLPFAFLFTRAPSAWNRVAHVALLAGIGWIVIGRQAQIPAQLPWFMDGWLSLDGLVHPPYLLWFGGLAAVFAAAWYWRPRETRWLLPLATALVAVPALLLTLGADRWCLPGQCDYLSTTSPSIRSDLIAGWRWTAENVSRSTIAYTGINLPYPLSGRQLTNRVIYVNIDGRLRWKFHDYDRAYRSGRFTPTPPLLAESSGELLPSARRPGEPVNAVRPRYERMQGIRAAWVYNLSRLQVRHLFIAALSAYEIDYVWHDDRGFPIEEQWASSDPNVFHLIYGNSQVRVYSVDVSGIGI